MATSRSLLVAAVAAAVVTIPLSALDFGHVPWALSRASGIAAFVVLSLSVVLGLLISTRVTVARLPKALVFEMHQFLSVVSLALIGVHAGALLFDGFLAFTPGEILVPFESPYRRVWTGLGVVGAWLTAITTGSFWVRGQIGVKNWRRLHYLTFGAYLFSLFHGIWAGTDTMLPVVFWSYVLSVATVAALLTLRIGESMLKRGAPPTVRATAARLPAAPRERLQSPVAPPTAAAVRKRWS